MSKPLPPPPPTQITLSTQVTVFLALVAGLVLASVWVADRVTFGILAASLVAGLALTLGRRLWLRLKASWAGADGEFHC